MSLINLYSIYRQATSEEKTQGELWYCNAQATIESIERETRKPYFIVAGIIAALSPMVAWDVNIRQAREFIKAPYNTIVSTYKKQLKKALKILKATSVNEVYSILGKSALKTRAFFLNLLDENYNVATIDRHIIGAYKDQIGAWYTYHLTNKRYKDIQSDIKFIAKSEAKQARDVQATIWITYKRLLKAVNRSEYERGGNNGI